MARYMEGPASLFRRVAAFGLDLLVVDLVLIAPFGELIANRVPKDFNAIQGFVASGSAALDQLVAIFTAAVILMILYFTICEYKLGQTFGKMVMGIFVKGDAGTPSLLQCVIRSVFLIPTFPFVLLWIVDPLYVVFSKDRVRLSEKFSKTKTVQMYNMYAV